MLKTLHLWLEPESMTDEQSLDMLEAMLNSWNAGVSPQVNLCAYTQECFTRQGFVELLREVGRVLEGWVHRSLVLIPSSLPEQVGEQHIHCHICVQLHDWEVWKNWWWMRLEECFPTLAMSDRLRMTYDFRECSSSSCFDNCRMFS